MFAVVPFSFPDRPGTAAGSIGGVSTAGGIVSPLIYGARPSIHLGYAAVAIGVFLPLTAFFLWAMRYEENLAAHGIGSRESWLGTGSAQAGGDD